MKALKTKDIKEFFEKRWWLGVGALVAIALLVVAVLPLVCAEKPEGTVTPIPEPQEESVTPAPEPQEETVELVPERQRVFLPNENEIWRLNVDNSLLTELYGKAHGLAINKFQDAKLARMSIVVHPHRTGNRVGIIFTFYSQWADRRCQYRESEASDMAELKPSEPAKDDYDRSTFDELPWLRDPEWPQFLRKTSEKAGPLSPNERTYYVLSAYSAFDQQWSIWFYDGVTGNEFRFDWDGKGDPIPWD